MQGRVVSQETAQKISQQKLVSVHISTWKGFCCCGVLYIRNCPFLSQGKPHSDETKRKISEAMAARTLTLGEQSIKCRMHGYERTAGPQPLSCVFTLSTVGDAQDTDTTSQ